FPLAEQGPGLEEDLLTLHSHLGDGHSFQGSIPGSQGQAGDAPQKQLPAPGGLDFKLQRLSVQARRQLRLQLPGHAGHKEQFGQEEQNQDNEQRDNRPCTLHTLRSLKRPFSPLRKRPSLSASSSNKPQ